jgi:type II secretion system protein G
MQKTIDRLRQRREELGDEGGFTLIELLIVIVILGILAAIVVFAVQNLTGQSAQAGCQAQFKTVETAMEAYKAQVGSYPTQAQGFAQLTTQQKGLDGNLDGPWLKDLPPEGVVSGTSATAGTATVAADAYQAAQTPALTPPGSQYFLTINPATTGITVGNVQVGTVSKNGAKADANSADGGAACASA